MANKLPKWTASRWDANAGVAEARLASSMMAHGNSGMEDALSSVLKQHTANSDQNAKSKSAANTANIIEQIRAGKTPERTGIYNAAAIADASYENQKYRTAQAFKQRAEARSIASASRARAAAKTSAAGLAALYGGANTPAIPTAERFLKIPEQGDDGLSKWNLEKTIADKMYSDAQRTPAQVGEDAMMQLGVDARRGNIFKQPEPTSADTMTEIMNRSSKDAGYEMFNPKPTNTPGPTIKNNNIAVDNINRMSGGSPLEKVVAQASSPAANAKPNSGSIVQKAKAIETSYNNSVYDIDSELSKEISRINKVAATNPKGLGKQAKYIKENLKLEAKAKKAKLKRAYDAEMTNNIYEKEMLDSAKKKTDALQKKKDKKQADEDSIAQKVKILVATGKGRMKGGKYVPYDNSGGKRSKDYTDLSTTGAVSTIKGYYSSGNDDYGNFDGGDTRKLSTALETVNKWANLPENKKHLKKVDDKDLLNFFQSEEASGVFDSEDSFPGENDRPGIDGSAKELESALKRWIKKYKTKKK